MPSPNNEPSSTLKEWQQVFDADGPDAALESLATTFIASGELHKLFEVRQMQVRHRLGLPAPLVPKLSTLSVEKQNELEEGLIDACREVGLALLDAGQLGEAWMYLRAVGDKPLIAEHLRRLKLPSQSDSEELDAEAAEKQREITEQAIHLALFEGVDPAWGLRLMLDSHGTCNSITTLGGLFPNLDRETRAAVSATVLDHLHSEVLNNLRRDMEQKELKLAVDANSPVGPIAQIIAKHPQLIAEQSHHIDLSHLMSVMQFSRSTDQREDWQRAFDLAVYGQHLSPELISPGDEPFVDFYPMHRAYFAALLGMAPDKNAALFAARIEALGEKGDSAEDPRRFQAAEIYVDLLSRMERFAEAATASAEWLAPGSPTMGIAPSLLELSNKAGDFEAHLKQTRERGDLLGYAQGILARNGRDQGA